MENQTVLHGNWQQVFEALDKRFASGRSAAAAAEVNSRAAMFGFAGGRGLHLPAELAGLSAELAPATRAVSGPPIVRAFWWGFHIEASSQGLHDFASAADPIGAVIAAIGPLTGPAAPWVAIAAAFIAGALELLKSLDRGRGVYISMSWFAPGIFIPTTVV